MTKLEESPVTIWIHLPILGRVLAHGGCVARGEASAEEAEAAVASRFVVARCRGSHSRSSRSTSRKSERTFVAGAREQSPETRERRAEDDRSREVATSNPGRKVIYAH